MINALTKKRYQNKKEKCPRCDNNLKDSDVKGYKFTCLNCDENFYNIEV
jgi:transposase-like protein